MREDYDQMELDTRDEVTRATTEFAADAVNSVRAMIERCGETPTPVRNRHEAYGIAAEHYAKIAKAVKDIRSDCDTLLSTLADPNYPAVEATSSIANSTAKAATIVLTAAAEMKRTLDNLYIAENKGGGTPMDEYLTGADDFEEAEPADADEAE